MDVKQPKYFYFNRLFISKVNGQTEIIALGGLFHKYNWKHHVHSVIENLDCGRCLYLSDVDDVTLQAVVERKNGIARLVVKTSSDEYVSDSALSEVNLIELVCDK